MADSNIFAAVADAIREETDQAGLEIGGDTTAADVPGWDSLTHARIVMNVERRLRIRLRVRHTYDAANVGELVELIAAQVAAAPPSA